MTPKEKAFELYFKFYRDIIADNDKAKQSALIAVDEIIKNDKENYGINGFVFEYWKEVKQEIEKL
jgi:hypothetical protein